MFLKDHKSRFKYGSLTFLRQYWTMTACVLYNLVCMHTVAGMQTLQLAHPSTIPFPQGTTHGDIHTYGPIFSGWTLGTGLQRLSRQTKGWLGREFWGTGHLLNSNPNFGVPVEAGRIPL